MKYNWDMEREADALAVEGTYAAGIDTSGIGGFLRKLMALHKSQSEGIDAWFTTHPTSVERIQNVAARVATLPVKSVLRKDTAAFQAVKKRVADYLASKPKPRMKNEAEEGPVRPTGSAVIGRIREKQLPTSS